MTTGNSDMAAKTGNSYITETITNDVEIPTASQVFLTMASPNNKLYPQVIVTVSDNRKWHYGR